MVPIAPAARLICGLDHEDDAKRKRDGHAAIVPGKLGDSELIRRIVSNDPDERMPPKNSGRELSATQIETLRRWVAEGAKWEKHWAFITPVTPPLPKVKDERWPRTPIDRFILARLEKEGLAPSPEADRVTLIRRMSLDLTGLPPTPAEVDAFVRDKSPNAYEKLVDRLLASPRYGERMAWPWLDAAPLRRHERLSDRRRTRSCGAGATGSSKPTTATCPSTNSPSSNSPATCCPTPTLDQRIATGFNRNHRGNGEGGIIPEEYAVEYVADRVETTATVWLGLTIGCCSLPRSQVRPVHAEGVLPPLRLLQQRPREAARRSSTATRHP